MSTNTENIDRPSSTKQQTEDPPEEQLSTSSEVSLDDEWAAALAEQDEADTAVVTEAPPASEASLDDEWAAALAEQDQEESAGVAEAAAPAPAPAAVTEEPPTTEAALADEWAAALAEQDEADAAGANEEPPETEAAAPIAAPATVTEEPPATEASLEDEWAAALAEQTEEEAAVTETVANASEAAVTEEPPTTEAYDLDNDWAAAMAEQTQEDSAATAIAANAPEATDTAAPPIQAIVEEEPPASEADLADEWAAALEEQEQIESTPDPATTVASDEHIEPQAGASPSAFTETSDSNLDSDEDMENDWADVLNEEPHAPSSDTQPEHIETAAANVTTQEDPKSSPIEAQSTEEPPSTDIETTSQDSVKMNWPSDTAAAPPPQTDPPPTEWKPTRIGEDPEAAAPSAEEMLAASMASSAAKAPPPELPLAAIAAQSSIDAVMEIADDVAAILQDEQAIEEQRRSATEAKGGNDSPPPSEVSTGTAEAPTASETQDLDPAPPEPQPPTPDATSPHSGEAPDRFRRPFFSGTGGSLFGMFTMNSLLTLLTFGVYSFWGRVKIRRYLHSQTRFAGARLAFHGTGGELFKGWMKAMAIFGIPYTALNYAGALQSNAALQWGVNIVAGLLLLCFLPIAIVGSHRYRMSRTSWRGIYFSFRHSAKDFITLYLKGTLFSILTLGIYYPIFDNAKRAFLSSGTHFGSRVFGFTGEGKELGNIYFKAFRVLILGLVTAEAVLLATSFLSGKIDPTQVIDVVFWTTVGIITMVVPFVFGVWFWFQAARQRYMWSHTTFGSARFQATMTGRDLCELRLTNLFLLVFTLGLAWPWVQTRNLQFLYFHVGLQGPLDLKQVVQEANTASPMGEELAGFFDTGFDLG